MVFKSLNVLTPEYPLSKLFVKLSDITEYQSRDSVNKHTFPLPHTNFLKNGCSYGGAVLGTAYLKDSLSTRMQRGPCLRFRMIRNLHYSRLLMYRDYSG